MRAGETRNRVQARWERAARVRTGWLWVLAAVLWLAAAGARAQPLLILDPGRHQVPLGTHGQAWIDTTGHALAANVATDPAIAWQPTREGAIYPLAPGKALWIRFTLASDDAAERWYLEIPYSAVNRVTLHAQDHFGQWSPQSAGDTLPVASWPLPHRHPVLPLALSRQAPQQFLVRVENPHSFSAPLGFTSERALILQEQRASLVLGLYFGLGGLALVLAVAAAISLRDTAFARYAVAVLVMGLAQAAMTGVAGLHLWPHAAWWNDVSALALPVLGVGTLMWLFSSVVSLAQRSVRLHRLMVVAAALSLPLAGALLVVDPGWRFRIMVPYVMLGSAIALLITVWSWRRGDRYAGWLLAGLAPVVLASLFPLGRLAGVIPLSFWTTHAMQFGIAIELPLVLMVLMARSQHRRENSRRIQGLDRMDPATGLTNAIVFRDELRRMMARSARLKHQGAVLLLDIVNIEQIRRDFGAREAEELPLRVAQRLLASAREIDVAGRLSDLRFGLLVEGPLSPEDAASCGPKVVARCLMPFKGKPVDCVAQVRVVQTLVPTGLEAEQVIERLEAALARVPANSRRAVFTVR